MLHTTTPGCARVEHREQCGQAAVRRPVAHRRGHRDQRHPGQPTDDTRQRALHPGDDDQAVGHVELWPRGRDAVQARDADVVDPLHTGAERPCHERRLGGDRCVGGPGGHHAHSAAGFRQRTEGDGPGDLVDERVGEDLTEQRQGVVRHPGRDRPMGTGPPGQLAQDRGGLLGSLASRIDDLGIAGAQPAVGVDPREAEVRRARHGTGGKTFECRVDGQAARRHVAQQRLHLGAIHAGKANLGPDRVRLGFGFVSTDLQLDRDTLEIVAVAAAALSALSFLLLLIALARLRALGRRVRRLTSRGARAEGAAGGLDLTALRHVGVVRYDAFGDMGGRLSFSAAVFDAQGDGFVLTSINGRSETRTYAKGLVGLKSEQTLSPEEQQAIRDANGDRHD